jgi:PAS domain S-box-containing protein
VTQAGTTPVKATSAPAGERAAHYRSRCARSGRWFCLAGVAVGALGLIGGIAGVDRLTSVIPGEPAMMPNTALGLILIGAAGALRAREPAGRRRTILSLLAAMLVAAIGIATLVEYVFAIDLSIDQIFGRGPSGNPHPGRPAPVTAVTFVLLAGALALFDFRARARARPSEWLVLFVALTALTALLGFAFRAELLHRAFHSPRFGLALPTAAALLLVSVGFLLERPKAGIMRAITSPGPGGAQFRRLLLPAVLIPVVLGLGVTFLLGILGQHELAIVVAVLVSMTVAVGVLGLAITAVPLNRVHAALEANRTHLRALVEQAPEAVFVADLRGRYTDVNSAACRMLGYSRDELVGKTIADLIPPEDAERLARTKNRMLEGGVTVSEWTLRRKDGRYVDVEVSAKIFPDGRWQAMVRDISERKRLATEQARLYQVAQQAIQLRDDVLGIVAHDLRNPLGTILMHVNRLRRTGTDHEHKGAAAIERAARRMNHLIQDLLDVARVEGGRLTIKPQRLSGAQLVAESVQAQEPLATAAALSLEMDVPADLPAIWVDRDRLLQILDNLVGNAVKYTPPGGRITVGARRRDPHIVFWVTDTGAGIAPKDLPHVFERLWQAKHGDRAGAGLGLTIVKGIVDAHGGRIWVESKLGAGTTFYFSIPCAPGAESWRSEPAPRHP